MTHTHETSYRDAHKLCIVGKGEGGRELFDRLSSQVAYIYVNQERLPRFHVKVTNGKKDRAVAHVKCVVTPS